MDIVTQGLVGATVALAGAKSKQARIAVLVGFCAPLLADADALIFSNQDPLLFLEYHRHFSHSLLFIPFGALLATLLLWTLLRKHISFGDTYRYAFLGYATAGLLDACTSYGTHLLWPFTDDRIAWSIISIFDPAFSFVLIIAILFGVIRHKPRSGRIGVVVAASYLTFGAIQHDRAQAVTEQLAKQRQHTPERQVVKPTMGNLLLWRSIYEADGVYYIDAIRIGPGGNSKVFNGTQVQAFNLNRDLPELSKQSALYRDIERFDFFSDGFLAWHPQKQDVLGDVRYSMLPTSVRPLWGITLDLDDPDKHVEFDTYRSMPDTERRSFVEMLVD